VGEARRLFGIVTSRGIEQNRHRAATLRAMLEADSSFPYVHPDQPLSFALERMGTFAVDSIPVVARTNLRSITGVLTLPALLAAYGIEHQLHRKESRGE